MRAWTPAGAQRGFTLVELMLTLLIAGILAAVAVPIYFGYTKDGRTAEGKAIAGAAMKALQGCVQPKGSGGTCDLPDIAHRVGLDPDTGTTGDGRWTVTTANLAVSGSMPYTLTGSIGVVGVTAKETNGIGIGLYFSPAGAVLRCSQAGNVVPASNAGDAC